MKFSECAYDADVSEQTIRRWVKAGKLKSVKKGLRFVEVESKEWEDFCKKNNIKRRQSL